MKTTEFLKQLYSDVKQGYITVWTAKSDKTQSYDIAKLSEIEKYVASNRAEKNIFFGVGVRKDKLKDYARGTSEDVSVITCLWHDLDIKSVAHKQTELPETLEEAMEFLGELSEQPSIVVNSGNGLHLYWLLDEPLVIMTEEHRKSATEMLTGFQRAINLKAKEKGWIMDTTSDLARILRMPGSINHKLKDGAMCEVIESNEQRFKVEDFFKYIAKQDEEKTWARTTFKGETGNAERCLKCKFIQHCRDNAETLPEPQWHAMISNLALASDGVKVCHELSSKYKGYNKKETESKVQRARQEQKPHTCKYIKDSLMFDCSECELKCNAPIALSIVSRLEKSLATISKELSAIDDVYSDEMQEALAYLKKNSMKDYALFKAKAKAKFKELNLVEFEKAISQKTAKMAISPQNNIGNVSLEGIDVGEISVSENYVVSMKGIKKIIHTGDNVKILDICNCPVIISERYVNLDSKEEKVQLAYYVDKKWRTCIGNRADIFNKATLLKFGNKGLKISTNNASELIGYLDNYEGLNMDNIKIKNSIDRLGWVGDDTFFPYVMNDIIFETDSVNYEVFEYANSKGTYEKWLDLIVKARSNKFARFLLATSITSPLIEKMGVRNFMVHLWDDSKSGKTALLKLALSFWGNPNKLMGTFNATEVSIELRASTLNNLPIGLDEKQVANEKKIDFETVIYMLSTGESKSRGKKDGGVQTKRFWRNIAMSTGEEPLLGSNAKNGSTNRCMQINAKPIDAEVFGKEIHNRLTRHYGFGGKDIIEFVCKKLKKDPDYLEDLYEEFMSKFNEQNYIDSYADYCSAICVGDYLISTVILDQDDAVAKAEALETAFLVHGNVINGLGASHNQRGVDYAISWLISNKNKFTDESTTIFGKTEGPYYYVLPEIIEEALNKAGYNADLITKELAKQNILTKTAKGKPNKIQKWINGNNARVYEIYIESDDTPPVKRAKT